MKRRNMAVDRRPAALASVVFTLITTTTPCLATTETSDACNLPTTYGAVTLPGVPSNSSWSGYARVSNTVSLFYHLSEATAHNGSNETAAPPPLIVWTNGGPGASSVLYGDWFQNVGAFHVTTSQVCPLSALFQDPTDPCTGTTFVGSIKGHDQPRRHRSAVCDTCDRSPGSNGAVSVLC